MNCNKNQHNRQARDVPGQGESSLCTLVARDLTRLLRAIVMLVWLLGGAVYAQNETIWVDDALPAGAVAQGNESWTWVTANPTPYSGTQAHQSANAAGNHLHFFDGIAGFPVNTGDKVFVYVGGNPVSKTDPRGLNPLAGAFNGGRLGATAGSSFGPIGTVAGGLIGAGVGAGIGWYLTGPMLQDKTPNAGEPGSWHTNPGSGQERLYGPDGRPAVDIDWDHDHPNPDGTSPGTPHGHNWDWSQKPPRSFPVPLSPWPRGRTCPAG